MLTPVRIADRGPAPLARTAEVRLSPTVYFEQEPRSSEEETAQWMFVDEHDIAVRPNLLAAYAFTDSIALVLPAALLWSPVVKPERGLWLTLGGGIYGFGFSGGDLALTDAAGIWGKQRLGTDFWLSGGVAAFHVYDSRERQYERRRLSKHFLELIAGIEAGAQLSDSIALTLLADQAHAPLGGHLTYSRLRMELVLVPAWWIDLGIHAGLYLHRREPAHVDPLVGFTVTGRW